MKICEKHAHDAISRSWLTCFSLFEEIFTFSAATLFLFYLSFFTTMNFDVQLTVVLSGPGFAVIAFIVYYYTHERANDLDEFANDADDKWSSFVADRCAGFRASTCSCYRC